MAQTYFAILTAIGEAKLANATALGTTLQLTKMAVGDGNGNTPIPSRTQTALVHENRRAPLNTLCVDPANASQIVAEQIIPEDIGGWWVREIGLYDTAGDLCAVANCPDTYKPVLSSGSGRTQIIRMVLIVANTSAVELKIDPSVVLASRGYVDQAMGAHAAAADPHPQYATDADLATHAAATDPHPQYLTNSEGDALVDTAIAALVSSALGNDPTFATTIINALALKAPLVSPAFTGSPTVPTPAQFDNSTKPATTAFARAMGLSFAGVVYLNSLPATLDATYAGKLTVINGGAAGTVTLPLSSGFPGGAAIILVNESIYAQTISRQGTDIIVAGNSNSANSYVMEPGTFAVFTSDTSAGVGWHMGLRTAQLGLTGAFGSSLASNGYQKLPSGLIIQWGQNNTAIGGSVAIAYPLAFPNNVFSLIAGSNSGIGTNLIASSYPPFPKTGFTAYSNNGAIQLSWLAIGN